jgi:hypothetical protein
LERREEKAIFSLRHMPGESGKRRLMRNESNVALRVEPHLMNDIRGFLPPQEARKRKMEKLKGESFVFRMLTLLVHV